MALVVIWDYILLLKDNFVEETCEQTIGYLQHYSKADSCDSPLLKCLHPEGSSRVPGGGRGEGEGERECK